MRYQVVARRVAPAGKWEYYPYWAPMSDKEAALRLARYAAQAGCEAAVLQSRTIDVLQEIGRHVVDGQVTGYLPAVRFSPGEWAPTTSAQLQLQHERAPQHTTSAPDAVSGPMFSASQGWFDQRRLALEDGAGGDLLARPDWQAQSIILPLRMDVLGRWLSLRRRVLAGALGGPTDGDASAAPHRRDN